MIPIVAANPGFPLVLGEHRFDKTSDGQLMHTINGDLRAIVPPEGFDDYVMHWPACKSVVDALTLEARAKAAQAAEDAAREAAARESETQRRIDAAVAAAVQAALARQAAAAQAAQAAAPVAPVVPAAPAAAPAAPAAPVV